MKFVLGVLFGLLLAATVSADTVWTYAGNIMDGSIPAAPPVPSCNCALTGSVVFADPITGLPQPTPLSWDFTDGTHTLTQANSTATFSTPIFPGAPLFSTWTVNIFNATWALHTQFYGSATEATDSSFNLASNSIFGYLQGNHGTWTSSTVPAAEPATGLLVGLVLSCAALISHGRKKPKDATVWETLA